MTYGFYAIGRLKQLDGAGQMHGRQRDATHSAHAENGKLRFRLLLPSKDMQPRRRRTDSRGCKRLL